MARSSLELEDIADVVASAVREQVEKAVRPVLEENRTLKATVSKLEARVADLEDEATRP